jgi:hypothetical protein
VASQSATGSADVVDHTVVAFPGDELTGRSNSDGQCAAYTFPNFPGSLMGGRLP